MNEATREAFRRELPEWALRGIVCAVPSGLWAVVGGYSSLAEWLGMVTGIGFWMVVVSRGLAGAWFQTSEAGQGWSRALRQGAWLVAGWTIGGALVGVAFSGCVGAWTWVLVPFWLGLGAEFVAGVGAVGLTEWIGQQLGCVATAAVDSYGWALLPTVLQGAAVLLLVGLAAATLRGLSWGLARWKRRGAQ